MKRVVAAAVIAGIVVLLSRIAGGPIADVALPAAPESGGGDGGPHLVDADCWFSDGWWRRSRCGWLYPTIRDGSGEAAALPVVVLHRQRLYGASRRATVYLMGGPGGASYLYSDAIAAWRDWQDRLGLDHDLVLYDQRGTGAAWPPIGCPELVDVDRAQLGSALDPDSLWRQYEQALLECAEQVPAEDRAAGLYSTRTAARDLRDLLDALRRQYGYHEIGIYSVSYGTRLAIEALADAAEVDAVVLDSIYPPAVDLNLGFADSFAAILARLQQRCQTQPDCARFGSLRDNLDAALARAEREPVTLTFDEEWLDAPQPVRIDAATLLGLVEHALYADTDAAGLPQRLAEAATGSFGPEWRVLIAEWLWLTLDPDFNMLTHWLIECRDNARLDPAREADVLARHPAWRAALQSPAASFALCDRLGVPARPLASRVLPQPTLVLAADFDPRTPADLALPAVSAFPASEVMRLPIAGHSVVDYDDCAARAAGAFLNSGGRAMPLRCGDAGAPGAAAGR